MTHITDIKTEAWDEKNTLITPVWSGVDRPDSGGWVVPNKLVGRFTAALQAGVVTSNPKVMTDIYGKTFVSHDMVVGRTMNADLKRLGF